MADGTKYEITEGDLYEIEMALRKHPYFSVNNALDVLRRNGVPVPPELQMSEFDIRERARHGD